ncbi:MAG: pyridoxal phosphate-dependent aminotransferase [Oscillospiraceae bacterium]|nr:pyridoxal phosphate-dependent aminotransferase [Oscillospiraceae bacterium]
MKISSRIRSIAPSATVALTGRVAAMKREGIPVINFGVGEPDFGTPDNINEAAKAAIDGHKTHYTAVAGILELRQAICEKLKKENGVEYTPEEISVGTGAKQPLFNTLLALCEKGDEVILPTPCWVSYVEMIKLTEATPVLVPTKEEEGFALDVDAIEKALTPNTRVVLINTPNNPTGAVYSEESLRRLAALAVERDFVILADEIYEKLVYGGHKHFSVASISPEVKDHTVIINGVSKAYAMTGWRLGYAAGPLPLIKGMNALQSHATHAPSSITQYASLEALTGPQDSVEEMRLAFEERRSYLHGRLSAMEGVHCVEAHGAFYLMPNVSGLYGKKTPAGKVLANSTDVAEYLLEEARIAVVPGVAFECSDNVRISYANSMDELTRGMDQMAAALEKLV